MTHDYKRHGTTTLFAALDVGLSLCMKQTEAGKFIWPASGSGEGVAISAAQLGHLPEGIQRFGKPRTANTLPRFALSAHWRCAMAQAFPETLWIGAIRSGRTVLQKREKSPLSPIVIGSFRLRYGCFRPCRMPLKSPDCAVRPPLGRHGPKQGLPVRRPLKTNRFRSGRQSAVPRR